MQKQANPSVTQKTLKHAITYVGIGLHTGRKISLVVRPGPVNSGIHFVRKDAPPGKDLIKARWYNIVDNEMCTTLGNEHGIKVSTAEHLLAALNGCGIDNAVVELSGPEVPIMDGSSGPFVSLIEKYGTVCQQEKRSAIWLYTPIEINDGDSFAILIPDHIPRITVEINFQNPAVGSQILSVELVNEAFRRDIARARTFGFADQLEYLHKRGLALGGSLRNAILVDGDRVVNQEGLRYKDEFVRHKILDCLGDLALAGVPIYAHLYAYKPGHRINHLLINKLFSERGAWSYVSIDELMTLQKRMQVLEPEAQAEHAENDSDCSAA